MRFRPKINMECKEKQRFVMTRNSSQMSSWPPCCRFHVLALCFSSATNLIRIHSKTPDSHCCSIEPHAVYTVFWEDNAGHLRGRRWGAVRVTHEIEMARKAWILHSLSRYP